MEQVQGALETWGGQSSQDRGARASGSRGSRYSVSEMEAFNILATGSYHHVSPGDPQRCSHHYLDIDPAHGLHRSELCHAVQLPVLISTGLGGLEEGGRPSSGSFTWPDSLASGFVLFCFSLSFLINELGATLALCILEPWVEKRPLSSAGPRAWCEATT